MSNPTDLVEKAKKAAAFAAVDEYVKVSSFPGPTQREAGRGDCAHAALHSRDIALSMLAG